MKKSTKIIIAGVMVLGVSGGVFAYGAHNHWNMSPQDKADFVTDRVSKKLDLDESQKQNLRVLTNDMMAIMNEIRESRQSHLTEVEKLLAEPVFNQASALEMVQEKTRKINEKAPATIASLALFLDSLNPDQKSELQSFIGDRMQHHRHER